MFATLVCSSEVARRKSCKCANLTLGRVAYGGYIHTHLYGGEIPSRVLMEISALLAFAFIQATAGEKAQNISNS